MAKRKSTNAKTSRSTLRDGKLVARVTTTVETLPAEIAFADILAAVRVDVDEYNTEAPWLQQDGYDHELDHSGEGIAERYRGHVNTRDNRGVVKVAFQQDTYDWYRERGASKQVAFELAAQAKQQIIDTIVGWYTNGWEYYVVSCEFNGANDSCGAVDGLEYAQGDLSEEVANNVAAELEREGFTVTDRPQRSAHKYGWSLDAWRREFARNIHSQDRSNLGK